ncbi:unnamed protein product [Darwinula stevensoni]|uniref:VPS37 C-terminal domain-containing protein n=1 Tax=Darwinula stevensoni TaxID=69355 RepID=A0A7R9A3Z4_9CRUS|nr:unnamed protein product [Darwinula stevensoni]CAG0888981.1 unnamed protein product [Darwinula stevensoni]
MYPASTSMGTIKGALSFLEHLNTEELNQFYNDSRIEDLVKDIPQVKNLESEKEVLMASNKSLAEFNLKHELPLGMARERLISKSEKAQELLSRVERKKVELESLSEGQSLDTIHALMQAAASEADGKSEDLVEKFLDGSMDVETFLEKYPEVRKMAHLRKVRADKMGELLAQQEGNRRYSSSLPGAFANMNVLSSASPPYPLPGSVPYPLNPTMPMPAMPYVTHR